MDFATNTENVKEELNLTGENNLLEIIKDICSDTNSKMSLKLKGKVNRIIAETDLKQHTSLHRVSTADESTATVLGKILYLLRKSNLLFMSNVSISNVQNNEGSRISRVY